MPVDPVFLVFLFDPGNKAERTSLFLAVLAAYSFNRDCGKID